MSLGLRRRNVLIAAGGFLLSPTARADPENDGALRSAMAGFTPALLQRALRPGHPRLYLADEEVAALRTLIRRDPLGADLYQRLQGRARRAMSQPLMAHDRGEWGNLFQARRAMERITTLAGLYRLDGDRAKAERAKQELLAAAALPTWELGPFLATAELSFGVAIGYDWLYALLSDSERRRLAAALIDKSLTVGLDLYQQGIWWSQTTRNWNQVCSTGLAVTALALADEVPEISAAVLDRSLRSIQLAMAKYAPNGGDPEGAMYWGYGGGYNGLYLAALQSTLGTEFSLSRAAGFAKTGYYGLATTDPLHLKLNFSDCEIEPSASPWMMWLAREFDEPSFAEHERQLIAADAITPTIFHLIWSLGQPQRRANQPPLNSVFARTHLATFRSGWNDAQALYLGFKGGDNGVTHSHLDLGTFVLDMLGERWAIDLGQDDSGAPGYYDRTGPRYDYFRVSTRGHNTLCFAGENQPTNAKAPITRSRTEPKRCYAIADLAEAYSKWAQSAQRGVAVLENRAVLVQDELDIRSTADLVWNFYTRAAIELRGTSALLSQAGERIQVRILSPDGVQFVRADAAAPPTQAQQPDVQTLQIRLMPGHGQLRIAVLVEPYDAPVRSPTVIDLADW